MKKQRKRNYAAIWVGLWRETIWLEWPCTQKELKRTVRENFNDKQKLGSSSAWRGRWVYAQDQKDTGANVHIIALRDWHGGTAQDLATLVHECFHATEYMLLQKGIPHNPETSETYAYTLDHIVGECLDAIQKVTNRRRGKIAT